MENMKDISKIISVLRANVVHIIALIVLLAVGIHFVVEVKLQAERNQQIAIELRDKLDSVCSQLETSKLLKSAECR